MHQQPVHLLAEAETCRWTDPGRSRALAYKALRQLGGPAEPTYQGSVHAEGLALLAMLDLQEVAYTAATGRCLQSLEMLRIQDVPRVRSSALATLGGALFFTGQLERATPALMESIALATDGGFDGSASRGYCILGRMRSLLDNAGADEAFDEALAAAERGGHEYEAVAALASRAAAVGRVGQPDRAVELAFSAFDRANSLEPGPLHADVLHTLGELIALQGQSERAMRYFTRALQAARATSARHIEGAVLRSVGSSLSGRGEAGALDTLQQALDIALEIGSIIEIQKAHLAISNCLAALDQPVEALEHHRRYHDTWSAVFAQHAAANQQTLTALHDVDKAREGRQRAIRARDKATQDSRAKSEFLADMGHDLRTPLNSVVGFAQMLAGRATLDERDRRAIDAIRRGANQLLRMVDDVVDLTRIEAGRLDIRPQNVDLPAYIDEFEDLVGQKVDEQGLAWELVTEGECPPVAVFDPARTTRILLNLVDNAVKFTDPPGSVTVVVRYPRSAGVADESLGFDVVDTGCGIERHHLGRIFDRLERGDAGDTAKGGSGLGLAIATEIAGLLGGALAVDSTPGEGSTFSFDLPISTAVPNPPPVLRSLKAVSGPVLVVDDDTDNRELLIAAFEESGTTTLSARDGSEAVAVVEALRPTAVLMDLMMPVLDGASAASAIRRLGPHGEIPIVAVSAVGIDLDSQDNATARFDAVVRKPVDLEVLLRLVKELCNVEPARSP